MDSTITDRLAPACGGGPGQAKCPAFRASAGHAACYRRRFHRAKRAKPGGRTPRRPARLPNVARMCFEAAEAERAGAPPSAYPRRKSPEEKRRAAKQQHGESASSVADRNVDVAPGSDFRRGRGWGLPERLSGERQRRRDESTAVNRLRQRGTWNIRHFLCHSSVICAQPPYGWQSGRSARCQ